MANAVVADPSVPNKQQAALPYKQQAILDAALELFVAKGFFGTTVPEVALKANVGSGTIYRYFASKEALVNALYQKHKLALSIRLLRDYQEQRPARETFHRLWSGLRQFVDDDPQAFAFLELHHHAAYLDDTSKGIERRMHDTMIHLIERAQARGEFRPAPPCMLIGLVLGGFTGVVRWSWDRAVPLTDESWNLAEQCAWEAVRA